MNDGIFIECYWCKTNRFPGLYFYGWYFMTGSENRMWAVVPLVGGTHVSSNLLVQDLEKSPRIGFLV